MKKGGCHTEESLAKMRATWTPERRARAAAVIAGDNNPSKRPEVRTKMSGDNNPSKRPEVQTKMRAAWTPERRAKQSVAMQDREVSLETRARNSAAHRGKKCPWLAGNNSPMRRPEVKAKISGDKSPTKRPETRAKMRASWTPERRAKQSGDNHSMKRPEVAAKVSGDKNPAWQGGTSREPYAWSFNEDLKEAIRHRDGYYCQRCGKIQAECKTKLLVHHIDYDKKNSDPMNLITLCRGCNSRVNTNRLYWTEYFSWLNKELAA